MFKLPTRISASRWAIPMNVKRHKGVFAALKVETRMRNSCGQCAKLMLCVPKKVGGAFESKTVEIYYWKVVQIGIRYAVYSLGPSPTDTKQQKMEFNFQFDCWRGISTLKCFTF